MRVRFLSMAFALCTGLIWCPLPGFSEQETPVFKIEVREGFEEDSIQYSHEDQIKMIEDDENKPTGFSQLDAKVIGYPKDLDIHLAFPLQGTDDDILATWICPQFKGGAFGRMNLPGGRYYVLFSDPQNRIPTTEFQFLMFFQDPTMVEFDLTDRVLVKANLKINGQEASPYDLKLGLVDPEHGWVIPRFVPVGDHQAQVYVKPGTYKLAVFNDYFGLRYAPDDFVVTSDMDNKETTIDVGLVDAEVLLTLPSENTLSTGKLVFEFQSYKYVEEKEIPLKGNAPILFKVPNVLPGEYMASYRSEDGLFGQSPMTEISTTGNHQIVVNAGELRPRDYEVTVKIPKGEWEYKFLIQPDNWFVDPLNAETAGEANLTNSVLHIPGGALDKAGNRTAWPRVKDDTGEVTFTLEDVTTSSAIYVMGTFNGWSCLPEFRMFPKGE